jgi:5-methylthioadenosine/S-adenosylhomocysteine deaminase
LSRLLIRGATVITMNPRREILPGANIAVEDGTILHVGGEAPRAEFDHVIDADGHAALPGLVNTHTHAAMTLMRGYADDMPLMAWLKKKIWPLERRVQPEDVYWGTLLACVEMLQAGVTTFNDMYYAFDEAARAVQESGIRACLSGVLLGFLSTARQDLANAVAFVKEYDGAADGRIVAMLGPHAPYTVPDDLMRAVIEGARDAGVGIHIHLSETETEVKDSLKATGLTPIAHMDRVGLFEIHPVLAAHGVHLTDGDLDIMARKNVGMAHCPGSNMKLASGVARVPEALKRKIAVGLGTDGAASNNNLDVLEEARLAALLHKVQSGDPTCVTAYQALEMATRGGARALGLEDRIGMIAPGMQADLALVDLRRPHLTPLHNVVSHLVYSARAGDVRTVLVNGRVVVREGRVTTVDEDDVMAQANRVARELNSGRRKARPV